MKAAWQLAEALEDTKQKLAGIEDHMRLHAELGRSPEDNIIEFWAEGIFQVSEGLSRDFAEVCAIT